MPGSSSARWPQVNTQQVLRCAHPMGAPTTVALDPAAPTLSVLLWAQEAPSIETTLRTSCPTHPSLNWAGRGSV